MKAILRMKDANMRLGKYDQINLPNLHNGLIKELDSDSSQLSKFLEHNYFSKSKIPGRKFRYFHKGYRPSFHARLKLFYLYVVVHEDWRVLQSVFRMKKTPWPKGIKSITPLKNLKSKRVLFFLEYTPDHEYDGEDKNLSLKSWAETSRHDNPYSRSVPEHLFNRFLDAYDCATMEGKARGKRTKLVCKSLKREWEDDFYVNYVKGNYNTLNLLLKQDVPSIKGTINIKNARFEEYNQSFADSQANFRKWRLNTYRYDGKSNIYQRRKDENSLYGRFGIKEYGRYISTIMNNAWIFFSEDCKSHHFTQEHKRGAWKFGLGGQGNGYHRLGAASIIARWDDDEKLQQLKKDFPNLGCIRPFNSAQDAKDFCIRWEGNFIVPEEEIIDDKDPDYTWENSDNGNDVLPSRWVPYRSLKKGLDFLHRDKNPERANQLWTRVVKGNHSLQHKYFSKSECDMAASYILRWLHRPRI